MRVATWNIDGIRARKNELTAWVAKEQPDLLCLQEVKASQTVAEELKLLPGYSNWWHCSGGAAGVSIHLKKAKSFQSGQVSADEAYRWLRIRLGRLHLASVYVPLGSVGGLASKLSFYRWLKLEVTRVHESGGVMLLCGDMNVARTTHDVYPSSSRRKNQLGLRPEERGLFNDLLRPSGGQGLIDVVDSLRLIHVDPGYTWWHSREARARNRGWRLDYVLASESLASTKLDFSVGREESRRDHAPLVIEFDADPADFNE